MGARRSVSSTYTATCGSFDFRYNHREKIGFTDVQRTIKGIQGERLTY
jgi:hypothetical protein